MDQKSHKNENLSPQIAERYIKEKVFEVTGLVIDGATYIEDALYAIALTMETLSARLSKED